MILSVLFFSTLQLTPLDSPPSQKDFVYETLFLDVALSECPFVGKKDIKSELLHDLLQIEKAAGIPKKYRGMVLAAACSESGYSSVVRGDGGKAVGILQLWPWWARKYGIDREDPHDAARVWTRQIMRALPRAKRKCGKGKAFVSAWAWVASGPKGWRCRAPRHYGRLKRWQRVVKKLMTPEPS